MGEAGKPQRRAGWTVLGVRWEVEKRGDAEVGLSQGEEKREFKLLTLLVFFK